MINTKLLRITRHVLAAVVVLVSLPGCGPRPVQGGTAGHLLSAGNPLPDVRVTVFQGEGSAYTPLGFGVTTNDGSFQLFQNQARGPLVLTAGEYHFTLESAGAPIQIPPSVLSHSGFGVVATLARAWEHRKHAHFPRSGDRGYPKIER